MSTHSYHIVHASGRDNFNVIATHFMENNASLDTFCPLYMEKYFPHC
jgi:chitinase